ncbi:YcgL domain-containing protein [Aeromonas bivalvium]|uniref:YcgL domain-containing protein n=1 Tax=Aeromonas bivalvium TaxID=440079 RepID=UPI003D1C26C8
MLCAVYKSRKKADTYLFVEKRDDFSRVPSPLMQTFGTPQLVLMTRLTPDKPLGMASVSRVMEALRQQGFYLQVPPPVENLLEQHKLAQAGRKAP